MQYVEEDKQTNFIYDEETLDMLEKRSEDAFSGKSKTFTLEESIENMMRRRNNNEKLSDIGTC